MVFFFFYVHQESQLRVSYAWKSARGEPQKPRAKTRVKLRFRITCFLNRSTESRVMRANDFKKKKISLSFEGILKYLIWKRSLPVLRLAV